MREIKFRAWSKSLGCWATDDYMLGLEGEVYFIEPESDWPLGGYGSLIELMQYTGLKDKNGVEIYEGDIVRCTRQYRKNVIEQVVWDEGNAGFTPFHDNYEVDFATLYDEFEVVGNIYENPELLEKAA